MTDTPLLLNVANICRETRALGPGLRSVVWVQGCPFHCRGCLAPNWIPQSKANLMSPQELAGHLLENPLVNGITFSGGEPMLQAQGLAETARLIRARREVNMICFSGFTYENLLRTPPNPGVRDFLDQLDVLVDGPYIRERNSGFGLRGSDNQRIIPLSRRLNTIDLEYSTRQVEVRVGEDDLVIVGIPARSAGLALDRLGAYVLE